MARLAPLSLATALLACSPAAPPPAPAHQEVVVAPSSSSTPVARPTGQWQPRSAPDERPKPTRDQAEPLFQEARRAMSEGRTADACELFAQSLEAEFALGTLLNLARCEEQMGASGKACGHYLQAMQASQSQPDRQRVAQERARALGCL